MSKRILVIEDDPDIAELVKLVLETEDFSVEAVLDPLKAVDAAKAMLPDAVLLDLTMPNLDGWEVFKRLRKVPELAKTPIAFLTAKSDSFDEMVGLHVMNADGYITKPFGKQELIDKTAELVAKSKK